MTIINYNGGDGDLLDIDWNPSSYTPTVAEGYSTSVDDLTSHLKGIDLALQLDVVGGRMDVVSTTSLKWGFYTSNQIMLHNGTSWVVVNVATEPTFANTANDMNGTAVTYDVVYDVFAKYSSATAFTLEFAKWAVHTAGASTRYSTWSSSSVSYKEGDRVKNSDNYYCCVDAHTSDAETKITTNAALWADCGTDPGADYRGLYREDGRWVYGPSNAVLDGRQYRWLGVVMLANDSGAKFKNESLYRYLSNYYNDILNYATSYNTGDYWTYSTATWRTYNNGTVQNDGKIVACRTRTCRLYISARFKSVNEGYYSACRVILNGSGSATIAWGQYNYILTLMAETPTSVPAGYNYITLQEFGHASSGVFNYPGTTNGYPGVIEVFT